MDLCTVILERDVTVDPRKYGPIVAPILGVTVLEAKMAIRKGRGILLEDIAETPAAGLVAQLQSDGIPARCVRNEDIPALPAIQRVTSLERAGASLRFRTSGDTRTADIPWDQIGLVSIGAVALPGFRDYLTSVRFDHLPALHKMADDPEGRSLVRENLILKISTRTAPAPAEAPAKTGMKREASIFDVLQEKFTRQIRVYADIVDRPLTLWARVPMEDMAYAYEQGSMKLGECWGFHLLVEDLRRNSAGAFSPHSLNFRPGADIKDLVFLQIEEFNRYSSWNLFLHRLGVHPCAAPATSSPSPVRPEPFTDAGSSTSSPASTPTSPSA